MLQGLLNYLHIARESITKAWKSIDTDHAYIHEGKKFVAYHKATINAAATLEFSFTTPETGYVHYRPAKITPSGDKVDTAIYKDAAVTAETGTALIINNQNLNSDNISGVELLVAPTFTDEGDLLPGFSSWLPGSEGIGQTRNGNAENANDEIVFEPSTTYRFLLTNGSSAANIIGFNFRWYEE